MIKDNGERRQFDPKTIEELTGYTVSDIIAMYKDYEHMAEKLRAAERDIDSILHEFRVCRICYYKKQCHVFKFGIQDIRWCKHHATWRGNCEGMKNG